MTKDEFKDDLAYGFCVACTANDWFCPTECDFLEKMRRIPTEKLKERYDHYDGYLPDLEKYIKQARY